MSTPEKQVHEILSFVRNEARKAEQAFDCRSEIIQSKARSSINLFDGDATHRLLDIVVDSRSACDELYVTYQNLVKMIDNECKSLLNQPVSASVLKEIVELIRWLNDESEIENNFSSYFNGYSLGEVASRKYIPTIESKMIQKYWETKYAATPEAIDAEQKRKEKCELEKAQRKQRQIELQKERERKEKQRQAEIERMKAQRLEDKAHMEEIRAEVYLLISEYEKAISEEINNRILQITKEIETIINTLKKEKGVCEQKISLLKLFQFSEKKQLNTELLVLDSRIQKLSNPQLLNNEVARLEAIGEESLAQYIQQLEEYLDRRFPLYKTGEAKDVSSPVFNEFIEDSNYLNALYPKMPEIKSLF